MIRLQISTLTALAATPEIDAQIRLLRTPANSGAVMTPLAARVAFDASIAAWRAVNDGGFEAGFNAAYKGSPALLVAMSAEAMAVRAVQPGENLSPEAQFGQRLSQAIRGELENIAAADPKARALLDVCDKV